MGISMKDFEYDIVEFTKVTCGFDVNEVVNNRNLANSIAVVLNNMHGTRAFTAAAVVSAMLNDSLSFGIK